VVLGTQLLKLVARTGLQPNAICYNAAIGASVNAAHWRLALQLLVQMPGAGLQTYTITRRCNQRLREGWLQRLRKAAQWCNALGLLARIPRLSLQPSTVSDGAAICTCVRATLWCSALGLLAAAPGFQSDTVSYNDAASARTRLARGNWH